MKSLPFTLFAAAAFSALAGCHPKTEVVETTSPDPMADELANAAPVELPPAVTDSVTFRCKDNSLVYVDFFQGDKLVNLRMKQGDTPMRLTAPAAGEAYAANGYSVKGDPDNITLTTPDKGTLTCKH